MTDILHMPSAALGKGGPIVSRFALGTMTFGDETDEPEAFRMLDLFIAQGGTFIDTANVYSAGVSEEIIGRWARQRGGLDDVILSTKGRFAPPTGSQGASRRGLVKAVDASLKRLQIEAIDLYFIHGWDPHTEVLETLTTLGDLVTAGKIHHIAWSNLTGWQLQKILSTAAQHNLPLPVALQPQYSLLDRWIELDVMPCALEAGLALTPWGPLGGGWLTGKYSAEARPTGATRLGEDPNRGVEGYDNRNIARTYAVLNRVQAIAGKHGRPLSHVALAWLATRPGVASILLGARNTAQLADNMAAIDLELEPGEIAELTEVSAHGLPPYPYGFIQDYCGVDIWKELGT